MLGVHPMTVSKWERNLARPPSYNVQQLLLAEEGAEQMSVDDRVRLAVMVITGPSVGALALVVNAALTGRRRGETGKG